VKSTFAFVIGALMTAPLLIPNSALANSLFAIWAMACVVAGTLVMKFGVRRGLDHAITTETCHARTFLNAETTPSKIAPPHHLILVSYLILCADNLPRRNVRRER
jgi:hypothetical protein